MFVGSVHLGTTLTCENTKCVNANDFYTLGCYGGGEFVLCNKGIKTVHYC